MVEQLRGLGSSNGATREVELPEYPLDVWPNDLANYFDVCGKCVGAPAAMAAVSAEAILAAVIGNTRPIIRKEGYRIPPAIWTFDLAEPGTGKSAMLDHAMELVIGRQLDAEVEFDLAMEWYEEQKAKRKKGDDEPPPEKPTLEHYYTHSATVEALGPITKHSPGICVVKDELIGMILDFNAYKNNKGSDRQAYLTWWSGQRGAKVDRIGSGSTITGNGVVCVTGSIQSGRFAELAGETAKDGLLARFLGTVHPDLVVRDNEEVISERDVMAAKNYIGPLRRREMAPTVTFSDKARRIYHEWTEDNAELTQSATGPARHFTSKLPLHFLKLIALLHCVHDPGAQLEHVHAQTVADARALLEYHRAHTEAAYAMIDITVNPQPLSVRQSLVWAIERCGGRASLSEIYAKRGRHDKAETLRADLEILVSEGVVRMEVVPTAGRSATVYVLA